jgi:hypothetical protein
MLVTHIRAGERQNRQTHAPQPQHGYTIRKKDRNWAVLDPQGQLVCLTVYKRGAVEVVRRLAA